MEEMKIKQNNEMLSILEEEQRKEAGRDNILKDLKDP